MGAVGAYHQNDAYQLCGPYEMSDIPSYAQRIAVHLCFNSMQHRVLMLCGG